MPFKLRLIRDFQKCIEREGEPGEGARAPKTKQKGRGHKRITKKNYNLYQKALVRHPVAQRHIANFFNIIGINEEAVRSSHCSESYFRTLFYLKTVKKVEARPQYLLLHLADACLDFPPIGYIIDRFNSFGDARFRSLAVLIERVRGRLEGLGALRTEAERETGGEFLERYTQGLGNRMFVCRINNNKMLLSRSLLEALEYDVEEFALETLRFRTPLYEAASAERYYDVMVKFMENMINLLDLVCDRISLETFLDSSIMRFRDCFFTKKNRRLHCKVKTGMPHPLVTIFEVEEITHKSEEFPPNPFSTFQNSQEVRAARHAIQEREIASVLPLLPLPDNFHPDHAHRVTSYLSRPLDLPRPHPAEE